jgi:hypothetical protein
MSTGLSNYFDEMGREHPAVIAGEIGSYILPLEDAIGTLAKADKIGEVAEISSKTARIEEATDKANKPGNRINSAIGDAAETGTIVSPSIFEPPESNCD